MFKCDKCGKEFKNKAGLGGHRASIHEGKASKGNPLLIHQLTWKVPGHHPAQTHKTLAEVMECTACAPQVLSSILSCPSCTTRLVGNMRDAGYTITEPKNSSFWHAFNDALKGNKG